jgi:predicted metal-dependent TIM-barrel fold hydrolase
MTPELFDAHIHPEGLTDADLESMRFFGISGALVTAHHAARESKPQQILEHFDNVVKTQLARLEKAGIRGYAALGVDPRSVPRRGVSLVLDALPAYFKGGRVRALGEIGLHKGGPTEEHAFVEQLKLARKLKLPVLVHTPHREKTRLTRRALAIVRELLIPPASVLVDHADGTTIRLILESGHFAGLTVHPAELKAERAVALVRKLGTERIVLNTDSGDGAGDLTAHARTAHLLEKAEMSAAVIERVCRSNAMAWLRIAA